MKTREEFIGHIDTLLEKMDGTLQDTTYGESHMSLDGWGRETFREIVFNWLKTLSNLPDKPEHPACNT